jgi:phosphoserine phosphatase
MRHATRTLLCLLTIAMGTWRCTGEDGAMGPTGPRGEVGGDGHDGSDGHDGQSGDDGIDGRDGADGEDGADGLNGASGIDGRPLTGRLLNEGLRGWTDEARQRLNDMMNTLGVRAETWDATRRPVAVFDWDNTMMKNDIGDATMFWMVRHDAILQPAGRDWSTTSPNLTAAARTALNAACDALAEPGEPLPTRTSAACADEIHNVYYEGVTSPAAGGLDAWDPQETTTIESAYAWAAQLQAGHSPEEIRDFVRAAYDQNSWAPIDQHQTVGSTTGLNGWVRIYDQMRDLVGALQENGFDVWIVSASPQFNVEVMGDELGVSRDHVIGIRSVLDEDGLLTAHLEGCGPFADASDGLITYDRGKRCWINKEIFHQLPENQLDHNPDPALRPAFVAGDSDTDIAMAQDATFLTLVLNRNKTQLMCNAYANAGGRWLVQPMFIEPKSQHAPYGCSTALDHDGVPIVDELGNSMGDQVDSIFTLGE